MGLRGGSVTILLIELGRSIKPQIVENAVDVVVASKPVALFLVDENPGSITEVLSVLGIPLSIVHTLEGYSRTRQFFALFRRAGKFALVSMEIVENSNSVRQSMTPIHVIVGPDSVIVVSRRSLLLSRIVNRTVNECSKPIHLLRIVLEEAMNSYLSLLEKLNNKVEQLEDKVVSSPGRHCLEELRVVKQRLLHIRRSSWRLREVMHEFLTFIKYSDEYQHMKEIQNLLLETIDALETSRERISDLLELYQFGASIKLTEIMKFLTIIGSIFIPLMFILGVCNMFLNSNTNLWNMPKLDYPYGLILMLLAMLSIVIGMILLFRKKGWI